MPDARTDPPACIAEACKPFVGYLGHPEALEACAQAVWQALLAEGSILRDLDSLTVGYGEEFLVVPLGVEAGT